ncbi:MAG: tetratricopeptide repeat protein [Planctomycetota bacterium]|jgi:TolA-binding protein
MVKENGLTISVLCGMILFGLAIACFADAEARLDLAEQHEDDRDYDQAEAVYKQIVADSPGSADAVRAQGRLAALYLIWRKQPQADRAYRELLAKFSEHSALPEALYEIASACERREEYERAGDLYQQVARQSTDSEFIDKAQLRAAKVNVLQLVESGNDPEAQAAMAQLIADFKDRDFANPNQLPDALYDIAKECQRAEEYSQARYLYRYILQHRPECGFARRSQFGLEALSIFSLGYTASSADVNTAVDNFAAKFAGQEDLPAAVYKIAVEYHMKAYRFVNKDLTEQAEGCFQNAALVFEMVANEFPGAGEVPKALRSAGDCHRKLGRYDESTRCFQKVVDDYPDFETAWNALFQIGRNYEDLKESGAISKSEADSKVRAVYEQLLRKHPSCPGAKHARRWLSRRNSK